MMSRWALNIVIGLLCCVVGWLLSVFWDIYRGPKIIFEKITINSPDNFEIRLRNVGHRKASECIALLETKPLSEVGEILRQLSQPTSRRMDTYILEESDKNILYSCWPITRDVIVPDMTDMKAGTAYSFTSRLPDFLKQKKKEELKEGCWDKIVSFPKDPGVYVAVVSIFDGVDASFVLIYEYLTPHQSPRVFYVGTVRKPRNIRVAWIRLKLWLIARKYRKRQLR